MPSSGLSDNIGRVLRVDLSRSQVTEERIDDDTLRRYIGGTGIGAKFLYDEVPPGVEWSHPENRLILASGPLGGTRIQGSGTFSVVTKGPLTDLAASSQANGFFGAYLRFSGFDSIVAQGASEKWVYLYLHDGVAELRDASHLVGKDAWETEETIREELGLRPRNSSVVCVGPAGENLVKFAGVMSDGGHMAGTNGTGAVMGSKRLKAIVAARGKANVMVKDRRQISPLAKEIFEDSRDNMLLGVLYKSGTLGILKGLYEAGNLPVKNYTTNIFPEYLKFDGEYIRANFDPKPNPCWACLMAHCHRVTVPEGPYKGFVGEEPEYEGIAAFGPLIGVTDPGSAIMLNDLNDRLGMDLKESGFVLSMAFECYERGVITKEDTDGLELRWGNTEAAKELLHRIARREGFGDTLAEGVMRAGEAIGGEAPKFGIYGKRGIAPHTHQLQTRLQMRFMSSITNSGSLEGAFSTPQMAAELGIEMPADPFSPEQVQAFVTKTTGIRLSDMLVLCNFASGMTLKNQVAALNAVTGWDYTVQEAAQASRRVINLFRAFNIRHGLTPDQEWPSPRMMEPAVDGPGEGKAPVSALQWEQMLQNHYAGMGWDRTTGKPLPDTLKSLDLEYVIPDLG